jgi:3-oxoacyl-[acyl-carrier protein] reductase
MDLALAGKTVLVTGSGQGLGRAIGAAFAAEGANVVFHYHSSGAGAEEAAAATTAKGVKSIAVGADLRDDQAVEAMVAEARERVGPIDILVNNAAATKLQRFLESTPEDWAFQVDVTVTGTLRVTQAVARSMVESGNGGAIVNLLGDSGRVGESGLLVTSTARSSTVGLTKSLAKELARFKIRANAVSLGLVQTDNFDAHVGNPDDEARMKKILAAYPLRRLGRPEDVTPTILLLASPASAWTTGQVLSVNGGYAMP